MEGDPAAAGADPDDLAAGGQLVQHRGRVARHPDRQHVGLPRLDREGDALELGDGVTQAVDPAALVAADPLPGREEAGQRLGLDGLDGPPHGRKRPPADTAQDIRGNPLRPGAAGPELAFEQHPLGGEVAQDDGYVGPPSRGELLRRERPMRAGVAAHEPPKRPVNGVEERHRKTDRGDSPERVTVEPRVLGRDQPLAACDPDPRGPACGDEPVEVGRAAGGELVARQVAQPPQQVVRAIGVEACGPRPGARPGRRGSRRRRAARADRLSAGARRAALGRAGAPVRGARRPAHRPRTCRSRCSRRGATRRTATARPTRPRPAAPRRRRWPAEGPSAPAPRRRPRAPRGRSRAAPGTTRTSAPPAGGRAPSAAAARAASAAPAGGAV